MKKKQSEYKLLVVSGMSLLFDAMDVGIISFLIVAISLDWNLTLDQQALITTTNAIGMALGAVIFGIIADKIGRKKALLITLLMFSIASGLTALTHTFAIFLILRFIIGLGLGGELPIATSLVSENSPPHKRGRMVVLLESFWALGWFVAAFISYLIIPNYGWRITMIICALPALYALYLRINLDESAAFSTAHTKQSVRTKIKLLWSKDYIHQTAMMWILWFCISLAYYGMFLWLPRVMMLKGFTLVTSFKYSLFMTIAQLPGYLMAAWLIEIIGRKRVLASFLLGTAISAYFFGNSTTVSQLLISGSFLSFFNLGAWGSLYAYTPEQYPASIRVTGSGFASAVGRIGSIIGSLLIPVFVARGFQVNTIFIVFSIALIVSVLTVLVLGKETKGIDLENVFEL